MAEWINKGLCKRGNGDELSIGAAPSNLPVFVLVLIRFVRPEIDTELRERG